MVEVTMKPLANCAALPGYAHAGDAGMDLVAAEDVSLPSLARATVSCGFAIAIPQGYAGFVLPRSGMASKTGVTVVNAPGLIDSGYRGEVKVALVNLDANERHIERGERIAQLVIMPTPPVLVEVADELDDTERGSGGFGSTGTR